MDNFFTRSPKIENIIKSFNLTKTLFVSSILVGEPNTGKKTLIKYLFPDAIWVSGENQKEVEELLETQNELVIYHFEKLSNHNKFDFTNKRIIAIANYIGNSTLIDKLFAFIYHLPPLKERPEDVTFLAQEFEKEAKKTLLIKELELKTQPLPIDLTLNSKSLKKEIYYHLFIQTVTKKDIQDILFNYFGKDLEGNNNYRKHLEVYEKPLIEAGLKEFGSQLKLSDVLGINRNTLRKKINEHNIN